MRVQLPTSATRRGVGVLLAVAAMALVATWPAAANLSTTIPLGVESELTVPVFSLWGLWWVGAGASSWGAAWDAPFFHPAAGVLAFSEPQWLAGIVTIPLWTAGLAPATVYNLCLLLFLVLNGLSAYRLARVLGVERAAALGAALIAVTLPAIANHLGVLPILPIFGVAWSLEGLVRFSRSGSWVHAGQAACAFAVLYLGAAQMALLAVPLLLAPALASLQRLGWRARPAARLTTTFALAFLLVGLMAQAAATRRASFDMERPEALVAELSTRPADFFTRPRTAILGVPPRAWPELGDTAGLFPGFGLAGLALLGVAAAVGRRDPDPTRRLWVMSLAGGVLLAMVLSSGMNLTLFGWSPFATLRAVVPGLSALRAPYRWVVLMQFLAVPLAALGLRELGRVVQRRTAPPLLLVVGLLAALENLALPLPLQRIPERPATPWSEWVRERDGNEVLLHLPLPDGFHVSDYALEARRMFVQMDHGRRIVNGYSSYFYPEYTRLQVSARGGAPDPGLLCVIARIFEVDLLVVDQAWLPAWEAIDEPATARMLRRVYGDEQVAIYELDPPSGACP